MLGSSSSRKKSGIAEGLEAWTVPMEVEAARTADMVNRDKRMTDQLRDQKGMEPRTKIERWCEKH